MGDRFLLTATIGLGTGATAAGGTLGKRVTPLDWAVALPGARVTPPEAEGLSVTPPDFAFDAGALDAAPTVDIRSLSVADWSGDKAGFLELAAVHPMRNASAIAAAAMEV